MPTSKHTFLFLDLAMVGGGCAQPMSTTHETYLDKGALYVLCGK